MARPPIVELQLPPVLTLGPDNKPVHKPRGTIRVYDPGKAPKLRFKPGSFFTLGGQLYVVMYAFRVVDEPHEWMYCCEYRDEPTSVEPSTLFPGLTEKLGAGNSTPRVVKHLFRDGMQAHEYFCDVPTYRDSKIFRNGALVGKAQVVTPIIMPEPKRLALE